MVGALWAAHSHAPLQNQEVGQVGAEHGHSIACVCAQAGDEAGVDVQHPQVRAHADARLQYSVVSGTSTNCGQRDRLDAHTQ